MAKITQRGHDLGLKINHKMKDFNGDKNLYLRAIYDDNINRFEVRLDDMISFQDFVTAVEEEQEALKIEKGRTIYISTAVERVGINLAAFTEQGKRDRMGYHVYKALIDHGLYGELRDLIGRNVAFDTDLLEWGETNRTFIYDGKYVIYLGDNAYEGAEIEILDESAQRKIQTRRKLEFEQKAIRKEKKKPEKVYNF